MRCEKELSVRSSGRSSVQSINQCAMTRRGEDPEERRKEGLGRSVKRRDTRLADRPISALGKVRASGRSCTKQQRYK